MTESVSLQDLKCLEIKTSQQQEAELPGQSKGKMLLLLEQQQRHQIWGQDSDQLLGQQILHRLDLEQILGHQQTQVLAKIKVFRLDKAIFHLVDSASLNDGLDSSHCFRQEQPLHRRRDRPRPLVHH